MAKHDHRPLTPPSAPPSRRSRSAPAPQRSRDDDDDGPRRPFLIYALLTFLVVGMGAFLWNAYDGGGARGPGLVRVAPAQDRFKEPGPGAVQGQEDVSPPIEDALRDPQAAPQADALAPPPEEPQAEAQAPEPEGEPSFVNNGPYVAQIAALQAEAGIQPLWRRLSERAPDLFANARMDVQRADLGPRGIYLRVRVGYFADRDNAARFCGRMRAMGQDCMAVER